jgi:peptidoglycan/xylan/chitin deacetylase (PgdA/CDA1 family)
VTRPGDSQRRILKRWFFEALRLMRADAVALRRHAAKNRLLVLNIHSVSPRDNPYAPSLDPELFGQLLTWLQAHATVGRLRDLADVPQHDPRRPLVVLSFDDGLKDFVEHAMPLLRDFGMAANQNVIGEAIETGRPPWAIGLLDGLAAAPVGVVQGLRVAGFAHRLGSGDAYAQERFAAAITNHLKSLRPADRAPLLERLQDALHEVVVQQPTLMMSAGDVAAAEAAGHEIGSHSYSHESMEHLDDAAFLADFRRSRDVLAAAGCDHCDVYAFPNGSHRAGQPELLQRHGVRHVLLVGERTSVPGAAVHTRITVRGASVAELRVRASLSAAAPARAQTST